MCNFRDICDFKLDVTSLYSMLLFRKPVSPVSTNTPYVLMHINCNWRTIGKKEQMVGTQSEETEPPSIAQCNTPRYFNITDRLNCSSPSTPSKCGHGKKRWFLYHPEPKPGSNSPPDSSLIIYILIMQQPITTPREAITT